MTILKGHVSPETAYVVDDYPYGFRLRCRIRFWVEYRRGQGCRMWSQTTNPKRGDIWNKPKASTYQAFGLVMMLNDKGHVIHGASLSPYCSTSEAVEFEKLYADALPCEEAKILLSKWVNAKVAYEAQKKAA